jgi:hypothetical protein
VHHNDAETRGRADSASSDELEDYASDRDVPTARPRRRRRSFALAAICIAGAGVASLVGLTIALEHGSFTARDLKVTNKSLTVQENELNAQLQQLENPVALAKAADKQGMTLNTQTYWLLEPSGRVVAPEDIVGTTYPVPAGTHNPGDVVVADKQTVAKDEAAAKARKAAAERKRQQAKKVAGASTAPAPSASATAGASTPPSPTVDSSPSTSSSRSQ